MTHNLPGQLNIPAPDMQASDQIARASQAPLRPTKPQHPCDVGLFGDEMLQTDLIEMFMD